MKEHIKLSVFKRIGVFSAAVLISFISISGVAFAGPIMHLHDSSGNLGTVDVQTGDVSVIGNMGSVMTDIAFDPSGNLYGVTFSGLYSIDASTATSSLIGNHGIVGGNALVFGSDGTLYGAGSNGNLYNLDTTSGLGSSLGSMGFASGGDLAFNGSSFYMASSGGQLIDIDLSDLSNTAAVGNFGVSSMFGLATGDDGNLYGVAGTSIYSINLTNGAATSPVSFSGQGIGQAFGQSFFAESGAVEVPEPGTMMLFATGLLGLAIRRKYSR